jgi:hypothetical protein
METCKRRHLDKAAWTLRVNCELVCRVLIKNQPSDTATSSKEKGPFIALLLVYTLSGATDCANFFHPHFTLVDLKVGSENRGLAHKLKNTIPAWGAVSIFLVARGSGFPTSDQTFVGLRYLVVASGRIVEQVVETERKPTVLREGLISGQES